MMRVLWHTGRMDISWEQALAWRMRRHYLIERGSPDDLVAVVDRLRGLHAQVMSSVDLALWARIDRFEQDAVADALWRQRTLVKMWAMRATLHVLPAADLGTWIAGLGIWKPGVWPLKHPKAIPLGRYIDRALRGKILTRTELAAAVTKLGATPEMVEGMLGSWGGTSSRRRFPGTFAARPTTGNRRGSLIRSRGCASRRYSSTTTTHSTRSLRGTSARTVPRPPSTLATGGESTKARRSAGWPQSAMWQRKSRSMANRTGC